MATVYWEGDDSADSSVGSNWSSGSVPGASDDVILDNSSTGGCTFAQDHTFASFTVSSNWDQALNFNGYDLTCSGNIYLDAAVAGSIDFTSSVSLLTITGDANFYAYDGDDYTGASDYCSVQLEGTGDYYTDSTNWDNRTLRCAYPGKRTTYNGSKFISVDRLYLMGGILDVAAKQVAVWITNPGDFATVAGTTIDGDSNLEIRSNYAGTVSIDGFGAEATRTGLLRFLPNTNNAVMNFDGDIDNGSGKILIRYARDDCIVDFNDYDVSTTGPFTIDVDSGDTGNVLNCGSGDITIGDWVFDDLEGGLTVNLESSYWYIGGSVDFATNVTGSFTFNADSAVWEFTGSGAETLEPDGKTMPDIIVNKSGNGLTLSSALTCGDLTLTDGTFNTGNYAVTCVDLAVNTSDTKTFGTSVWTASGNGTYSVDVTFQRLILSSATTHTFTGGITFTLTSYTSGDWNGTNLVQAGSGQWDFVNPASMTVTGIDVEYSNASNTIDATDPSNTDSGNNTGWNFGVVATIIPLIIHQMRMRRK